MSRSPNRNRMSTWLSKATVLLMLFLAPLAQARSAIYCSMAGGEVNAADCCCGESHDRMRAADAPEPCCTASVELGERQAVVASQQPIERSLPRVGGDPEPLIVDHSTPDGFVVVAAPASRLVAVTPRASARSLYLVTARLRL
jgi:hypothetical protein